MKTNPNRRIEVRKMKSDDGHDYYDCRECGRRWKSTDNKIGHRKSTCDARQRR